MSTFEDLITTYSTTVRFRDLDPLGHVNNAVYMTWMEESRVSYLLRWGLVTEVSDIDFVIAHAEIDFQSPAFAREAIDVKVVATRLGNKSFELRYKITADGRPCASGMSVAVPFDPQLGKAKVLPDNWRKTMEQQVQAYTASGEVW